MGHKRGSVEGKGSPEDPLCAYTHRPKQTRLRLMCLNFEGSRGRVPAWIEPKFGKSIPPLVVYILVKFHGNPRFVQQLTTILVFGFRCCLEARVATNLTNKFLM